MGRKELVLINLAPASSPCLLTGLLALVLPSRCAPPSLQVELVLHFVLVVRRGGGCFWTCLVETGQERTKNGGGECEPKGNDRDARVSR